MSGSSMYKLKIDEGGEKFELVLNIIVAPPKIIQGGWSLDPPRMHMEGHVIDSQKEEVQFSPIHIWVDLHFEYDNLKEKVEELFSTAIGLCRHIIRSRSSSILAENYLSDLKIIDAGTDFPYSTGD